VQGAIDRYYPMMPAFFGKKDSENNALYRRCGIKQRTNEEMRQDFIGRVKSLVEGHLKLKLPAIAEAA
jgi:ring-1,2-phenylacetyl-CoA epoxidase subunit PaaA